MDVARFQLARAEDAAAQRLLLPHLETLAGLLLDAIGEANAISARVHNSRPLWAPSRALTDAVRKLDLTRDLVVR